MIDKRRVRVLREGKMNTGPIVYVMGRDFRMEDNWALLYAQEVALERNVPLCVLVHFGKNMISNPNRQHHFLIDGLKETAGELESRNIPLFVTVGDWKKEVKEFISIHTVGMLVTDFSPLHESRWWWDEVSHGISIPIHEVDAHNIVPCWHASNKEEYTASAFRKKMDTRVPKFLKKFPEVKAHPCAWGHSEVACWPRGLDTKGCKIIDWEGLKNFRKVTTTPVEPVSYCKPGTLAAHRVLINFIANRLKGYATNRNNPTVSSLSDLSPYIRFGFISAQRVALEILSVRGYKADKTAFLEELILRREFAENYCFYNEKYDSLEGLYPWAQKTLKKHTVDIREYTYSQTEFENAMTHDKLWNAAQSELLERGKIHGYMRMYWAKKILEWSPTPQDALKNCTYLNDTYALDSHDPNSYVGILEAIGGLHDRAWAERAVTGTIRYMNYAGCERKFNVDTYISQHSDEEKKVPVRQTPFALGVKRIEVNSR